MKVLQPAATRRPPEPPAKPECRDEPNPPAPFTPAHEWTTTHAVCTPHAVHLSFESVR